MYTGYAITRLTDSYQGSLRVGGRRDLNGYPIHHLVLTKVSCKPKVQQSAVVSKSKPADHTQAVFGRTASKTPKNFNRTPIELRLFKIALAKKDQTAGSFCSSLGCSYVSLYKAMKLPHRFKRIAIAIRILITEAGL